MLSRLSKLKSLFLSRGIDACVIFKNENIRYLTNFLAEDSWLLVTSKRIFYITDARYTHEVRQALPRNITVVDHKGAMVQTLFDLVKVHNIKHLGFEEHVVTLSMFSVLSRKKFVAVKLVETRQMVEELRLIKDDDEVRLIQKSLALHKQAHQYLKRVIKPGLTEWDILLRLERFVKERNAGFSFDPIVASGPNSAFPHAKVTQRKIGKNDIVLLDMGIDLNGYKSDLTRIFLLGKIAKSFLEVIDAVANAKKRAIEMIKPGVSVAEVDKQARKVLEEKKLEKYFTHSLGHGVGLEIHEAPRLSEKSREVLKAGMVVTVEPGVYLPGRFGIRLEDMVLVTEKGCKILSDDIN